MNLLNQLASVLGIIFLAYVFMVSSGYFLYWLNSQL